VLLALATATGAAACPLNLDYLDKGGPVVGSDASLDDAPSLDEPTVDSSLLDDGSTDTSTDQALSDHTTLADTSVDTGSDVHSSTEAGSDVTVDAPMDVQVVDAAPEIPALLPDAATVTCPTTIDDALQSTDPTQTGRLSRVTPTSACGMTKTFPGSAADPSNPHLYHAYRFVNPSGAASCFTFTLTYPATASADASTADASMSDASLADASSDDAGDGSMPDASPPPPPPPSPQKFMTAYTTYYPVDIANGYLGDVGAVLVSPQTMAITVPAGGSIDVVVFAVDVAPAGVDTFTLSCTAQ
jgi:hypothetical protein